MTSTLACLRSILAAVVLLAAIGSGGSAFAQKPEEGGGGGGAGAGTALSGNQIKFRVRSTYPNVVDVAFYADGRRHSWPGGGRIYSIRDSNVHDYVLNCIRGEKICYGAGVRNVYNKYWGVGIGNKHRCSTCCHRCMGQQTNVIVLNP